MSTKEATSGTQLTIEDYCGTVHDALEEAQAAYDARFHEPDWDALTPCVRRLTTYEKLVGFHTITEEQHEDTSRLVEDTGKETVRRAIEDSHDDSDYSTEVSL